MWTKLNTFVSKIWLAATDFELALKTLEELTGYTPLPDNCVTFVEGYLSQSLPFLYLAKKKKSMKKCSSELFSI